MIHSSGMQIAVIKTGGKQYLVQPGQKLNVEKLVADEGKAVSFDDVLLAVDGEDVKIGAPALKDARVEAEVLKQGRDKKIIVFKYGPKTRRRVKRGHRQHYTEVLIKKIVA